MPPSTSMLQTHPPESPWPCSGSARLAYLLASTESGPFVDSGWQLCQLFDKRDGVVFGERWRCSAGGDAAGFSQRSLTCWFYLSERPWKPWVLWALICGSDETLLWQCAINAWASLLELMPFVLSSSFPLILKLLKSVQASQRQSSIQPFAWTQRSIL